MNSFIKTYTYDNGEIQRVQVVECDSFSSINFFKPKIDKQAIKHIASIYKDFFIKQAPYIFGEIIVFHIPEEIDLPFEVKGIKDKHIASKIYLKKHRKTKKAQDFIKKLEDLGYLYIVKGKNPFVHQFVPYKDIGFISKDKTKAKLRVNASFFTFDLFDCQSKYDIFGTPIGLCVKDGKIINPPLFNREAFLVDKNNKVIIKQINLHDLDLGIKGIIYERPESKKTPKSNNYDLVIINDEIVSINKGGNTIIPSSGFVLSTLEGNHYVGEKIIYKGLEDIIFGIQCGNSIIIEGKKTEDFISKFYHFLKPGEIQYPPTQYPHDYNLDRAPRIAIGENKNHKPVIIWVEGASKMMYQKGIDSCGASLKEMSDILDDLGIINAVNLDGGGSAQILIDGKRSLKISDRDFSNNEESERAVPLGLYINE